MPPASIVLLPSVFPTSTLILGTLLPDPLSPNIDKFTPSPSTTTHLPLSNPVTTIPFFRTITLSASQNGIFPISPFPVKLVREQKDEVSVEAKEMVYRGLNDVNKAMKVICEREVGARKYFDDMARGGRGVYFVVGLEILKGARMRRVVGNKDVGSMGFSIDGGGNSLAGGGMGLGLSVDMRVGLGLSDGGKGDGVVSEGIWGIEVLRAKWRFFNMGWMMDLEGEERVKWERRARWKWVYEKVKGVPPGEETEIAIELEKISGVEELVEIHETEQREREAEVEEKEEE